MSGNVTHIRWKDSEFVAPLGELEKPTAPFEVSSMDTTGQYLVTPCRNKYLLTFIDYFTKYVEAFRIPEQAVQTCQSVCNSDYHLTWRRVYADNRPRLIVHFFIFQGNV
jgi:hypothetical protein